MTCFFSRTTLHTAKMPNHVRNIWHFSSERKQAQELLKFIQGENGELDFNSIVPMSKKMDHHKKTTEGISFHAPAEIDWYHWSIENWGTKWNAYEFKTTINDNGCAEGPVNVTIQFDTAWSPAMPVLNALSRKYPEIEFGYLYADEDIGSNFGVGSITNGEDENSADARLIAARPCRTILARAIRGAILDDGAEDVKTFKWKEEAVSTTRRSRSKSPVKKVEKTRDRSRSPKQTKATTTAVASVK